MNARLLGLVLIALLVWTAVEVYDKGVAGAFGGILAGWSDEIATPVDRSARAAGAFQRAWDSSESRVERALERESRELAEEP